MEKIIDRLNCIICLIFVVLLLLFWQAAMTITESKAFTDQRVNIAAIGGAPLGYGGPLRVKCE